VLTILLGIALGIGVASLRIKMRPWNPAGEESAAPAASVAPAPNGPAPKVNVGQTEYKFGTLDMHATGTHDFVFSNTGKAPLVLRAGASSCRCAWSKIEQDTIPPGGSSRVTLTWKPKEKSGPYQQTATILTNDPAQPKVGLTVTGRFATALQFFPQLLVFSHLSVGEKAAAQSALFCRLDEPLKILGHTWSDTSTAPYFDVTVEPLSEKELKEEPSARSGVLVKVAVKPGMLQGVFQQDVVLQTNVASMPQVSLPVQGIIGSGEITVAGHGWDPDTGILTLGRVPRREGLQRRLTLVVRGPWSKQVEFKPDHIEPSELKVTVGPRGEIGQGSVVQTPLIIDIPPGSPTASFAGTGQSKLAEIILATTHPKVPKLRIFVRFVIEG
jgi:hypothetical protein